MTPPNAAKIIKASNTLQQKAGLGSIDPARIERAETAMQQKAEGFEIIADKLLQQLEAEITRLESVATLGEEPATGLINPIMQIKGNAAMFGKKPASLLAQITLSFLEHLYQLDIQVLEIVKAQYSTLKAALDTNADNNFDEKQTLSLKEELLQACARYAAKYPHNLKEVSYE